MSVIIYARVSTGEQAERDLSIPAQLRALRRYAEEHHLGVAAEYQDVGSGRSFRERPGLMAAIQHTLRDRSVDTLLIHRVDRLARNTYDYLTLKGKLRRGGVRVVSLVEHFESNPMGDFLEHIMAAQAEFYSANLGLEVKKGLHERLRRGEWNGMPPVGYLRERARLILDPARAPILRWGFERWATGEVTLEQLVHELHARGLVGRTGKSIAFSYLATLLKNPFYLGAMVVKGVRYPGIHPPLISNEIFERCQEVFRQKRNGAAVRQKHLFLLSGKISCPKCGATLVGEHHVKRSTGRIFRYYRCHRSTCSFLVRCDTLDERVVQQLRALRIAARALPVLLERIRQARAADTADTTGRLRVLRAERERLNDALRDTTNRFVHDRMALDHFELQEQDILGAIRAADQLIADARQKDEPRGDKHLLALARAVDALLLGDDMLSQRRAAQELLRRVVVIDSTPSLELAEPWHQLLRTAPHNTHPLRGIHSLHATALPVSVAQPST